MEKRPIWILRAGEGAAYVDEFLQQGLVAIGWPDPGPLDPNTPDAEIERRFAEAYPAEKEGWRRTSFAMVKRFLREMKVGDAVATYDRNRRVYPLGTVAGEPRWRDQHDLPRWREVRWSHEVSRDLLSVAARNSLGAIATFFRLSPEIGTEMWTKAQPLGSAGSPPPPPPEDQEDDLESEKLVLREVESKAQQFVEDRLARLDWKQMQELVAGILRAMKYRTRVAEEGPDRGVDIFASPDGLGLQEPRIFVEVKHRRNEPMGATQIRSFLGGRKPGDRCLYVSTGGFSKDARYEADRSPIPLTLLGLPEIRDLVIEHYAGLDEVTRSLVPLRQIYWPAD